MAQGKTGTLSKQKQDNKTIVTVNKTVELVVVDNQLVPDIRDVDPGVICGLIR